MWITECGNTIQIHYKSPIDGDSLHYWALHATQNANVSVFVEQCKQTHKNLMWMCLNGVRKSNIEYLPNCIVIWLEPECKCARHTLTKYNKINHPLIELAHNANKICYIRLKE